MSGIELINAERERQISKEGWDSFHDDDHKWGEMAHAAACYAKCAGWQCEPHLGYNPKVESMSWPWEKKWWKPSDDKIRNLAKAGALIAAEIDRLNRLNK